MLWLLKFGDWTKLGHLVLRFLMDRFFLFIAVVSYRTCPWLLLSLYSELSHFLVRVRFSLIHTPSIAGLFFWLGNGHKTVRAITAVGRVEITSGHVSPGLHSLWYPTCFGVDSKVNLLNWTTLCCFYMQGQYINSLTRQYVLTFCWAQLKPYRFSGGALSRINLLALG